MFIKRPCQDPYNIHLLHRLMLLLVHQQRCGRNAFWPLFLHDMLGEAQLWNPIVNFIHSYRPMQRGQMVVKLVAINYYYCGYVLCSLAPNVIIFYQNAPLQK